MESKSVLKFLGNLETVKLTERAFIWARELV